MARNLSNRLPSLIIAARPNLLQSPSLPDSATRFLCSSSRSQSAKDQLRGSNSKTGGGGGGAEGKGEAEKRQVENRSEDGGDEEEEEFEFVNKETGEVGGPRGPEPTRYGDWEKGGRCSDF